MDNEDDDDDDDDDADGDDDGICCFRDQSDEKGDEKRNDGSCQPH